MFQLTISPREYKVDPRNVHIDVDTVSHDPFPPAGHGHASVITVRGAREGGGTQEAHRVQKRTTNKFFRA